MMEQVSLTPRQNAVLHTVQRLATDRGFPPTAVEIAAAVGLSETRVRQHLDALETRGAILREPGTARGLRVTTGDRAPLPPAS